MRKDNIDKIFKDKLAEYETPVDPALWAGIEKELDGGKALPFGVAPVAGAGKKAIFNWRKVAYYGASVAALLIIGLFLFRGGKQEQEILSVEKDMVAENVVPENNVTVAVSEGDAVVQSDAVAQSAANNLAEERNVAAARNVAEARNIVAVENDAVAENNEAVEDEVAEHVQTEENEAVAENVPASENVAAAGNVQNRMPVEYERAKRGRREYTLALASNFISSNNVSVSPQYLNYMSLGSVASGGMYSVEQISETQYSLPLNVGLQAQVKINNLLSVGLGLNYTLLKSKYDALINKRYYHIRQNLHYIGVPVNLYFNLVDKKNFFFYANVGGAIEKGIKASYRITSYDALTHRTNADMDGFQYSANLGFGMEYRFIPLMGIYLEPNLVYYFNSDIPASIRTDQPVQVKAEIGFRFHINNK